MRDNGAQYFDELMVVPGKGGRSEFVFVGEGEKTPDKALKPTDTDNPKTELNDSQVNEAVYAGHVARDGYQGLCRGEDGSYFGHMSYGRHMAFCNQASEFNQMDQSELGLPVQDVEKLVAMLGLGPTDFAIKPGGAPEMKADGTYTPGYYQFTQSYTRLSQLIGAVENSAFLMMAAGVQRESLVSLLGHMKMIMKPYEAQMKVAEQQDGMWWKQFLGMFVMQAIFSVPLLLIFYKQLKMSKAQMGMMKESIEMQRKMMVGDSDKNRLDKFATDLIASEKKRMASDVVASEIRGRDSEAVEFLNRLARPRYANPMVVGPSGVGKDKIVERAAQLIAIGDPRVPKQFKDGTIKGIYIVDPSAFSANTGIRGDSAARAHEIIKAMNEGYAVYFPEIADFLSSGAAMEGSSESLASQLKDALTRGTARFAGSTTQGSFQSLVRTIPWLRDIERRMPPMEVTDLHIDMIRDVIPKSMIPYYESAYDVKITDTVMDKVINLALKDMSEGSHARIDAIDQLLVKSIEGAVQKRRVNGEAVEITDKDVYEVVQKRTGKTFVEIEAESASFEEIVPPKSAEDMAMERSFAQSLVEQMKADRWFSSLDESARRDAVRVAGSLLLGDGGERFLNAEGAIKVKDLAREVKPLMPDVVASSSRAPAQPAASESRDADRNAQVEVMRRMLVQEAELAAAGREKPLGFDIGQLTETDQQVLAERAFARFDQILGTKKQGDFAYMVEDSARLKDGAALRLLAEAMAEAKDPRKGLARDLANEYARVKERAKGRADGAERAAETAKKGFWSRFSRK
ncbi:MAG: hypothetical protein JXA24_05655 [Proteobacteria bacterium]|nr:hypothetical protein [Pseudomonadota bacterium]